jgi:GMP synthase-like glutamine amidotransferase
MKKKNGLLLLINITNNNMEPLNKKPVLIIKNATIETPGLLEEILLNNSIIYQVVDLEKKEVLPSSTNFGALIVLGGPSSANDTTDLMILEIARIKEAMDNNIPYFGICLGLQTLVKAMGGKVISCTQKEIGFRDIGKNLFNVRLTDSGKKDPLLDKVPPSFPIFHLHGETVELTENMKLIGNGNGCTNQLIKVGEKSYGIQGHIELTHDLFDEWMNKITEFQTIDREECRSDFNHLWNAYHRTGKQILLNFFKIAGYQSTRLTTKNLF